MYKKLLAVATLALVGAAAVPAAFAQDSATDNQAGLNTDLTPAKGGWFVDGSLGASRYGKSNNYVGTSYAAGLNGGYRFVVGPDLAIGPEIGYVYLGHQAPGQGFKSNYYSNGYTGDGANRLRGITLGGNLRFNLTQQWYISLRGGAFDARGSGLSADYANPVRRTFSNNIGYYAGVGTGLDINRHWSVGVTADYYNVSRDKSLTRGQWEGTNLSLDTEVFAVQGEYRF